MNGFREARVIPPSPAMLKKGEQLKIKGRNYQILGVSFLILCFVALMYFNKYNTHFYFFYSESGWEWIWTAFFSIIFFFVGVFCIIVGKTEISAGEKMFKDVLIPSDFSGMNGHDFNEYIVKIFTTMDYSCNNLPKSGDRGADFLAEKDGVRYVVQTKRWKNKVSDSTIQKLVGAKSWYGADKAICVTNSDYTKPARQWQNRGVELINGRRLDEIVIELQQKNNQRVHQQRS